MTTNFTAASRKVDTVIQRIHAKQTVCEGVAVDLTNGFEARACLRTAESVAGHALQAAGHTHQSTRRAGVEDAAANTKRKASP